MRIQTSQFHTPYTRKGLMDKPPPKQQALSPHFQSHSPPGFGNFGLNREGSVWQSYSILKAQESKPMFFPFFRKVCLNAMKLHTHTHTHTHTRADTETEGESFTRWSRVMPGTHREMFSPSRDGERAPSHLWQQGGPDFMVWFLPVPSPCLRGNWGLEEACGPCIPSGHWGQSPNLKFYFKRVLW